MATKNVTDENFETEVLKAVKPTLVDFWAEWCGPCKQIGPILEEISNDMSDQVVVAKHNIDEHPNQPTKLVLPQNQILFPGLRKTFNLDLIFLQ